MWRRLRYRANKRVWQGVMADSRMKETGGGNWEGREGGWRGVCPFLATKVIIWKSGVCFAESLGHCSFIVLAFAKRMLWNNKRGMLCESQSCQQGNRTKCIHLGSNAHVLSSSDVVALLLVQLWKSYFDVTISFVTQPALQLDMLSAAKRNHQMAK